MWNEGFEPLGSGGMDCLQLRQPAGPFHYLINEQAKSLVALQELQHEVGALLEFRDLVMETFPNLRTKLASSTSATMTTNGHHNSNIPVSIRPGEWTPGVRVRKKIGSKDDSRKKGGDIAVQDSGFSTETSSKETHSASSTALATSSSAAGVIEHDDDLEDELWNLLDIIHRKGTRLKNEAKALQGTISERSITKNERDVSFQGFLFASPTDSSSDALKLREERDLLLDKLAEMEAEVLAGRIHTSRLQEDLENLMIAKQDLEEQLKAVVTKRGEVNSQIHDLHLQFVTKTSDTGSSVSEKSSVSDRKDSAQQRTIQQSVSDIDGVFSRKLPKVAVPDSKKIRAILKERNPLVLQKHLLTSTVKNQVLQEQLNNISTVESGLRDRLDKFKEENEDLKFKLENRTIELEGTKARLRVLEDPHKSLNKSSSPDIIPTTGRPPSRTEISTASMKAMSPLMLGSMKALNLQADHSSSTESAQDQTVDREKKDGAKTRRPSKIPLKSYTAPKPPGGKHSPAPGARSRSGDSLGRPHSAQSWRNNKSEGNSLNCPKANNNSLTKSRNNSLGTAKDSLSGKLRSAETVQKASANTLTRSATMKKTSAKKDAAANEKIQDSNSAKEKSQFPWILSSFNGSPDGGAYPDSLDKNEFVQPSTGLSTSCRFHTANNFFWNGRSMQREHEYYDSIDTNMVSSMFRNGEEMAECDSLDGAISDFFGKN
ncbi:unnamed protein product [Phyllotreta striolata]|uniref:Uncharacterized protein n=1 Tax=Phyllotreta striolata TaxID=444603 RepID=A0A9P0GNN6_PHYSR|nr:unnamed protein product [Phyllotreta striolata]